MVVRVGRRKHVRGARRQLEHHALDGLAVARIRLDRVEQEAHAKGDVAVFVAFDEAEALAEAREDAVTEHVVADQGLTGHGQEALHDQVVGRHALDEQRRGRPAWP